MASKQLLSVARRKVDLGGMRHRIALHERRLAEPVYGATEHTEEFEGTIHRWAAIKTTRGRTLFQGVNGDTEVTHEMRVRYDEAVSSQKWVQYRDRLFEILSIDDLDERREFKVLLCSEKGLASRAASKA